MNYNEARQLMVDNQIKPNKVNDKKIIDLFQIIEKELFLPEKKQKHAYIDCEIEIVNNTLTDLMNISENMIKFCMIFPVIISLGIMQEKPKNLQVLDY